MLRGKHLMFCVDSSPCWSPVHATPYPQYLWWGVGGAGQWYQAIAAPFIVVLLFP